MPGHPVPGASPEVVDESADAPLVVGGEVDVAHLAARGAHHVVMVAGEPLVEFDEADPVGVVGAHHHPGIGEDAQAPVQRGEGDVEAFVESGGGDRPVGGGERGDDGASGGGVADAGVAEAVGDLAVAFGEIGHDLTMITMRIIISNMRRVMIVLLAVALAACGGAADDRPRSTVVATTPILGDIVSELVGSSAEVVVLLPVGSDPHDYAPSAADAARLRDADLVIANGLHLEEALEDALDGARDDGVPVMVIGELVDPVLLPSGEPDPHLWLDPLLVDGVIDDLASALGSVPGVDPWAAAEEYRIRIGAAHAEAESILSAIPGERRLLVSGHDFLRHFAARYGFTVVGVVVPGGSTAATPGARDLAALADEMRRLGVDDVFTEAGDPIDVVNTLATEAGAAVHPVYSASLGPEGSGAETYLRMIVALADAVTIAIMGG